MGIDCLHPPLLLHLGSPVLVIVTVLSSSAAGLAVAWHLSYFGPCGCRLVAVLLGADICGGAGRFTDRAYIPSGHDVCSFFVLACGVRP